MPQGGMRARPIDLHPCPVSGCEDKHEAAVRISGWPVLVCPKLAGPMMRLKPEWAVIVVGVDREKPKKDESGA